MFKQIFFVSENESNKTKEVRTRESKNNSDEDSKKEKKAPLFSFQSIKCDNEHNSKVNCLIKICDDKKIISICEEREKCKKCEKRDKCDKCDSTSKDYYKLVAHIVQGVIKTERKADVYISL